jgi:hypothetical protein
MQGLDKERINQIIEAASKGSKFYEHKKKQQARVDAKAAELIAKRNQLTAEQLRVASEKVRSGSKHGKRFVISLYFSANQSFCSLLMFVRRSG